MSLLSPQPVVDPFDLLEEDHQDVEDLFDQLNSLEDDVDGALESAKVDIVQIICHKLAVHAQLEDELIYPALREVIESPDLIDESEVDHEHVRDLIAQLEMLGPDEPDFDATVELLAEAVRSHVQREEAEVFPMARDTDLDLPRLGRDLEQRRAELDPVRQGDVLGSKQPHRR